MGTLIQINETRNLYFEVEQPLDKCKKKPPGKICFKELTVGEIKNAEHQILTGAQRECYHRKLDSLINYKLRKSSTILSLRPMLTDDLRWISTKRNDRRFRREIATKLFRHETIFNFHMNNFDKIIENIIRLLLFKMLNPTEKLTNHQVF